MTRNAKNLGGHGPLATSMLYMLWIGLLDTYRNPMQLC